jgi:Ca2+-binding RTX toxin-like protein
MPISNLVAAQLAFAAYTPLSNYNSGIISINGQNISLSIGQFRDDTYPTSQTLASLPGDWKVDLGLTFPNGVPGTLLREQFVVFRNQSTSQIMFAFKGTNSWQEVWSDVADSGATAWDAIKAAAQASFAKVKELYPTFEIMADGHSLGGGMAQTFALLNGLDGYGQNSLPIASRTIDNDFGGKINFAAQVTNWGNSGKTFAEVNTYGDPATMYYSFLSNNAYLNKTPQALANIYGPLELLAAAAAAVHPVSGYIALAALGYAAHIPQTIISALQGSPLSVPQATLTGAQANSIGSIGMNISNIVQQGSSFVATQTDGKVFTVTQNTTGNALTVLSNQPSGQDYFYDATKNIGFNISSSSLVGHETALVSTSSGVLQFAQRTTTGNGVLELPDGTLINNVGLPSGVNAKVNSISGDAGSSLSTLTSYLASVGFSTDTLAEIAQLHLDQLHPSSIHTAINQINNGLRGDGRVSINNKIVMNGNFESSANFAGAATGTAYNPATGQFITATAYNVLEISGSGSLIDFSRSALTNFQELQMRGGSIAMTTAQFNSFSNLSPTNYGTLHITTGGAISIAGKGIDPSWVGLFQILVDSQDGTTVTGEGNSWIRASMFGNDTLNAGSGGATLFAGYGANQLNGGSGNDNIYLRAGQLAAGSNINGGNGTDTITSYASSVDTLDISLGSVVGVESLSVDTASVKLNTTELGGFASVQTTNSAGLMLVGSNAGSYNLSGKSLTGTINLTGSAGDDVLVGGSTTKKLYGGAGNDRITYNWAATTIDGGIGNDTLVFTGSTPVSINLANASIGTTTISGIESVDVTGATAALSITGDGNSNTITGGSGADTLLGGDGDDTIVYDANDVLEDGGAGNDTLVVNQSTATTVNLTLTADQVVGPNQTINFENVDGSGSTGILTLIGDAGANVLKSGTGADTISGGAGDDSITYGLLDIADGGTGNDTLVLNQTVATTANLTNTADQVTGSGTSINFENLNGTGSTAALTLTGDANSNILNGGLVNDTLNGGAGNDTLSGGAGDDFVSGGLGVDSIYGGDGNDTLSVRDGEDAVGEIIDGGAGTNALELGNVDISQDTVINIQTLRIMGAGTTAKLSATQFAGASSIVASGGTATLLAQAAGTYDLTTKSVAGNINLTGSTGNDVLVGGTGAQTILAGAGDDTVTYDAADISIDGGTGDDTLILAYGVAYNLANATNQVTGATIVTGFEHVVILPPPDLILTGDAGNNTLTGGTGNDTLDGLGGDDVLDGAGGADTMRGGTGTDYIYYDAADLVTDGGTGTDILMLKAGSPSLTINLSNTANQVSGSNVVTGFEYVHAVDMTNGVIATGDANVNIFNMGSGDDTIDGGAGADQLLGNGGNDRIVYDPNDTVSSGGAGNDTLVVNQGAALSLDLRNTADQVTGGGTTTGFENVDGSGSTAALTLIGDAGNTILRGGLGADVISDAGGDDTIDGGAGADSLYGNGGNDTMTYDAADIATDGSVGNDTLVVSQAIGTTINLSTTSDQVVGGGTTTGFENINGTGSSAALTLTGDASANILRGGSGNDRITYDAADFVEDGAAGRDWLVINSATALTVDLRLADQISGDVGLTSNFENLDANTSTGAITVTGDASDNFFNTGAGNDTLTGGAGYDFLAGSAGSDTYFFARGDGADVVAEYNPLGVDKNILSFLTGINYDQFWFKQESNNLEIDIIGTTDKVTVGNWYIDPLQQVQSIRAGGLELVNTDVINLVNAMASMAPPGAGQTTLSTAQHAALDPVIAANWHAAA